MLSLEENYLHTRNTDVYNEKIESVKALKSDTKGKAIKDRAAVDSTHKLISPFFVAVTGKVMFGVSDIPKFFLAFFLVLPIISSVHEAGHVFFAWIMGAGTSK